jgi:hypothetical protein
VEFAWALESTVPFPLTPLPFMKIIPLPSFALVQIASLARRLVGGLRFTPVFLTLVAVFAVGSAQAQVPPTVAASFNPTTVRTGGTSTSTLTVSITNPNGTALTGVAMNVTFPAGMLRDVVGTSTFGGTGVYNFTGFSISNVTLAAGATGSVSMTVHTSAAGANLLTTSTVTSNEAAPSLTASATLTAYTPVATSIAVISPATVTSYTNESYTITCLDQNGATFTGYTGALNFTSTDPSFVASSGQGLTLTNGTATFNFAFKTAGTQTLTATDTVTPSLTGTSPSITVTPGATVRLAVSAPSVATPGAAFNFTVRGADLFGNTTPGYTGTVTFTSTDGTAILPANTVVNGTGTFSATLNTPGFQSITATDTVTNFTGVSDDIQVDPVPSPTFTKAFGASSISVGGTTTLTFSVTNPNATTTLHNLAFTDSLPAGLVVATPNGLTGSIGGGTITATAGSSTISLSGATLAGNGSGTFTVNVTGTTAGTKSNTTGAITSLESGTGGTASASLDVATPTTTVASIPASSTYGQTANLSATVTVTAGGAAVTTGTVTFFDTTTAQTLASGVALSGSGVATFSTTTLGAGAHSIQASYVPAAGFVASSDSGTLTVSPATLTVTAQPASKVYGAALPSFSAVITGFVNGQTTSVVSGAASLTATATTTTPVGPATITAATGTLAATNYTFSFVNGTLTITPAALTVSGVTAANKTYDSTTGATLNTGSAALLGLLNADVVTLDTTAALGTFATATVGTAKPVTITGLVIGGANASNYTLTQPSATADITVKNLTVTGVTAANKVYDATTTATLNTGSAALVGIAGSDAVTLDATAATGTFATATVGTAKPVTVAGLVLAGGAVATNYTLTQPGTTANITAKAITVAGVTASNKVYDATTTATLNTGSTTFTGVLGADVVTLDATGVTATFATKTVGTAKAVTISGLALGGAAGGNYSLTQPTATADITVKTITASGVTAASKVFDGTVNATISTASAILTGVVGADVVSLTGGTGTFATAGVGPGKTVTITGLALAGVDAPNYVLASTTTTATASITAALATLAITNLNQVYDGTPKSVTVTVTPSVPLTVVYSNAGGVPPTNAGSYFVTATVTDNNYSGSVAATLVIARTTQTVSFASVGPLTAGTPVTLTATASSGLPVSFSVLSGSATLNGNILTPTGTGPVVVRASQDGNINLAPASADQTLTTTAKRDQTIAFATPADRRSDAAPFALNATASSGLPVSFALVSGPATIGGSTLTLSGAAGAITVRASQAGDATFNAAPAVERTFTITPLIIGRFLNLSARARAGTGASTFITGFVIANGTQKQLLARAVGPTLTTFGVTGALADPLLRISRDGAVVAENDNWAGNAAVAAAAARTGAFPLAAASADSALLTTLSAGAYSTLVTGGSGTGVVLTEIYAADSNVTSQDQHFVNFSVRAEAGAGDNVLIVGFVVGGETPQNILLRAVGPGLTQFGIQGALADPRVQLYRDGQVIAANEDLTASAAEAAARAGAFPLPAGSKDAALVFSVTPGAYSVILSGASGTTGVALLEVYEVP